METAVQMKYKVDPDKAEFAYLQLYEQLRDDIVHHVLTPGMRLPSKRLMAEETGLSIITVEHAYGILMEEGYIESRQRSGFYVVYQDQDTFTVAETVSSRKPLLQMESHVDGSEQFPFSVYARTLRRVISVYGDRLMAGSEPQGCLELRQALADYLARSRGLSCTPEQIVIGAGSGYCETILIQMLGAGKIYGVENPCFERTRKIYRAHGVRLDLLKLGPDGILSSELERTPARVLHVTPYNSYPSGITATAAKRQEYIRWAAEREAYIIEDDYDSEFSSLQKPEDTLFAMDPDQRVLYVNTFTETISPGIRTGYFVMPVPLIEDYVKKAGFYSCPVPLHQQLVLAELLNSGDFERHLNKVRRQRRSARKNR